MRSMTRVMVAVVALVCSVAALAGAQSTATSTATKKFQVIAVDGNSLVVRLPEGTRELTVPDDFKFTVNGTQMSVHELKPGMAGTATITTTTTTTPVTVTEVKNGTVQNVTGSNILVRTEQGFRNFSQGDIDKRGVKIYKGGKPVELSDLHSGDRLTATIVTTMPPKVVTDKEVQATLAAAPAAAGAAAAGAGAAAAGAGAAAARATGTTGGAPAAAAAPAAPARKLPKTAGSTGTMVLVGVALLAIGAALRSHRRGLSQ